MRSLAARNTCVSLRVTIQTITCGSDHHGDGESTVVKAKFLGYLSGLCHLFIDVTAPGVEVRPPSPTKWAPVMLPARSEQRNSTVLATSSAVP